MGNMGVLGYFLLGILAIVIILLILFAFLVHPTIGGTSPTPTPLVSPTP